MKCGSRYFSRPELSTDVVVAIRRTLFGDAQIMGVYNNGIIKQIIDTDLHTVSSLP